MLCHGNLENLLDVSGEYGNAPTRADLREILRIHRGIDSFVAFMHADRAGGGLKPLTYIKVENLESLFPEFLDELVKDSFYSIHGYYRAGTRKSRHLRYLNACFSDLDHHGMPSEDAAARVLRLVRVGAIPAPSIIGFSGRGSWLFWILRDPKTNAPPKAHPEKRVLWNRLQAAINERLKELAPELKPDANAVDGSRVTRVPGSINSKSDSAVRYLIPAGAGIDGYAYSIDEMTKAFNVPGAPAKVKRTKNGKTIRGNRRGWDAMNQYRLNDFNLIEAARDGFSEGCRNSAVLVMSTLLRALGCNKGEAESRILEMAARCKPAFPKDEARETFESVYKSGIKMRNTTIADRLGVSLEEADRLELQQIRPDFMPKRQRGNRDQRMAARRDALETIIAEHVESGNELPSQRALAAMLKSQGHSGNKDTIGKDLETLGIVTKRKRKRNEDKRETNRPLPFPDAHVN